jgi:hypothetical protein
VGSSNIISGTQSFAAGLSNRAAGEQSIAMGSNTTANGDRSTAMGRLTTASGNNSAAMGFGTTAYSFGETVIGMNNTLYTPSSTSTFSSGDRLFVIGNGSTSSSKSDALTILKNGTLTVNGATTINNNATITGTLTLPSLSASTLLGTNDSKGIGTVSLTGDITTNGLVATLSNTGVISGAYGSSTAVPQITVDSKGRITTITNTTITASGGSTITYTIGSYTELGGYVFYVTPNGMHGLVAETIDQSTPTCTWYVAQDEISKPANHSSNGQKFTDWRLPTKYELNLMYLAKSAIGGFADNYYWSSTEYDSDIAWIQGFGNSFQDANHKVFTNYVRAIRAF